MRANPQGRMRLQWRGPMEVSLKTEQVMCDDQVSFQKGPQNNHMILMTESNPEDALKIHLH